MAVEALAPCVATSSAAMILSVQDCFVPVSYYEKFELPAPS